MNDEVFDMLSASSKVDREGKQLPNRSSNSSLDSNSAIAPEPIRKKPVPVPRKLKTAVPPVPKPRSTLDQPTPALQLNSITSGCSNESPMPASRPNKITPRCSNESLDGDLPLESIDFQRSESSHFHR